MHLRPQPSALALALVLVAGCADEAAPLAQASASVVAGALSVGEVNLGAFTTQVSFELGPIAPNPAGTGGVQLLWHYYRDKDNNPWKDRPFDVVVTDLETGTVSVTPAVREDRAAGFRVFSTVWGPDDILYFGTVGGQITTPYIDLPAFLSFDWRTQAVTLLGRTYQTSGSRQQKDANGDYLKARGYTPQTAWHGLDGAVYFGMSGSLTGLVRYDPATDALSTYGNTEVGIARSYYPAYNYYGCTDGEYVYLGNGKRPWAVVAIDETELRAATAGGIPYAPTPDQILMTIPEEDLILPMVTQREGGCGLRLFHEPKDGQPSYNEYYLLANGQATRITAATTAQEKDIYEQDPNRKPSFTVPTYDVLVDTTDTTPDEPEARLWFRRKGLTPAAAWQSSTFPVNTNPWNIERLVALDRTRVVGYTGPYGSVFDYDLTTGAKRQLGPSTGNVYTMLVEDGLVYLGGYADGLLEVYDPLRPWTFKDGYPNEVITDARRADSNLRLIDKYGTLMEGVTHIFHLASDYRGRIFMGAHAERVRVGGALGIYDPVTRQASAITTPTFANDDAAGLSETGDGRYVVYSSRVVSDPLRPGETPTEARLFVYDAVQDVLAYATAPFPGLLNLGELSKGPGTLVIGRIGNPTNLVYAFDAATGQVVWQKVAASAKKFQALSNGTLVGVFGLEVVTLDGATGITTPRFSIGARTSGTVDSFAVAGESVFYAFGEPDLYRGTLTNSAPVAVAQSLVVSPDEALTVTLAGTDGDGDVLTFEVVSAPTLGSLSGTPPHLVYTPAAGATGTDGFRYRVDDGFTSSATVEVTLEIRGAEAGVVSYAAVYDANGDFAGTITCRQAPNGAVSCDVNDDGTLAVTPVCQ